MFLKPMDLCLRGLRCAHIEVSSTPSVNINVFKSHYGSSPYALANQWYDLTVSRTPGAILEEREKTQKGLLMFFMAHYFLWTYPRNHKLLQSRFRVNVKFTYGKNLWKWIEKIGALKEEKIVWDPDFLDPETEIFYLTIDGTDYKVSEKKNPTLPQDPKMMPHKFNHAALKYEIAISI